MEGLIIFLLVLGGIILAAGLFCVWAIIAIVRAIGGVFTSGKSKRAEPVASTVQVCNNRQCGCTNPSTARFCRRCGKSLPSLLRAVTDRVAML